MGTDECIGPGGSRSGSPSGVGPVMRATTLKVAGANVGRLLDYYAGLAEDRQRHDRQRGPVDYYLDPDEPRGRWWGSGRGALGLDGEVEGGELRALLEARHPATGRTLGRGFGDSSARGFDATFSAPKSVSALWALTPDRWVRAEVLAAHDTAVEAALGGFETHGAVTRRGTDGVFQVDTQGIAVAVFRQHTSRAMDPQLHTHAVISAKVQDSTGKWLSLDAAFLKRQQKTIGWIYDAALRAELTGRLGVEWAELVEGGHADLESIPEQIRDLFSNRSVQVDEKLAELIERWSVENDGDEPDARTIAALERDAVTSSRPPKADGVDASELHRVWTDEAIDAGLDPDELTSARLRGRTIGRASVQEETIIVEALRRVSDESATWLRADVARHIATLLPPEAHRTARETVDLIDRLADEAVARSLELTPETPEGTLRRRDGRPVTEHVVDRRLTTGAVLDQEQALQDWAVSTAHPLETPYGDPQADAAKAIAGTSRLVVVVGPAGTGKTTTVTHAAASLRRQGRKVIGLAPSGKAADVLAQDTGCVTDTLAGFLTRARNGNPPAPPATTIVLDEAGMAHTDDLAALVGLAKRYQYRIVAIGDPAQLPAVGRGGVFAHWCETVPSHQLATPRRFDKTWEAKASLALRAGDPAAAETYGDKGRLHGVHPALVARQIAEVHQRHADRGRTVAITTNTTETAQAINREIQYRLDPAQKRPGVTLADGTTARVGDQIATRRNDAALRTSTNEKVRNRHTWTIDAVASDGGLFVSHPTRGMARLPAGYVELGWAVTGYGNQGDTVDIGIAVLEPGTTRNHAYVAMTRGRMANHARIPDPTGTTDPATAFADMINRTTQQESALATLDRLGSEPRPTRQSPAIEPSSPPNDPVAKIGRRLDALQRRGWDRGRSLGL